MNHPSKLQLEAVKQKPKELDYEELWDWCCTEVYRLDNGGDVWKQISKAKDHLKSKVRTELLEEILEENFCDLDGTYDYDGIAESVIKLCKNK